MFLILLFKIIKIIDLNKTLIYFVGFNFIWNCLNDNTVLKTLNLLTFYLLAISLVCMSEYSHEKIFNQQLFYVLMNNVTIVFWTNTNICTSIIKNWMIQEIN